MHAATFLPVLTALVALASAQKYNPETQDPKYGNRIITSIRTDDKKLCLTAFCEGDGDKFGKGASVKYTACKADDETQLDPSQKWTLSYPAIPIGPTSLDPVNGTVTIAYTTGEGVGCLTPQLTDKSDQLTSGVDLKIDECTKPELQVWDTFRATGFTLEQPVDGKAACMFSESRNGDEEAGAKIKECQQVGADMPVEQSKCSLQGLVRPPSVHSGKVPK